MTTASGRWRERPDVVGALVGAVCALLALGPALRPGYLLFYDMVFVPRLGFGARTLGVDGSVPRAVPNDLVVALLSQVAPGWLVQKVLLVSVFVGVGAGVAGLFRTRLGAGAAALVAAWNPWLGERLAIGHWGFLLGYAVLPWIARAAAAARSGRPRDRARLSALLVLVALTGSTAAILALILTAAVLLVPWRGVVGAGRTWLVVGLTFLGANAPWWFPFLVLAPAERADPAGVAAFASRGDTPLGAMLSVVSGGGIWNEGVWFAERGTWPIALVALAATVAVLVLAARDGRWRGVPGAPGILAAGILGVVLAVLSAVPGGRELVTAIVVHVPGGGLLRDSQKMAALWMLVVAVAAGFATERLRLTVLARGAEPVAAAGVAAAFALWPVATLPGMAWGKLGDWRAVQYPTSYLEAATSLDHAPEGSVAVFPWGLYRKYAWNGERVTLDPWQRLVQRRVLVNDDLPLSGQVVRGESGDAATIRTANARGEDLAPVLRGMGVRYAVRLTDQPTAGLPTPIFGGSAMRYQGAGVEVLDLGRTEPTARAGYETARAAESGSTRDAGLVLGILALAGTVGYSLVTHRRQRRPMAPD
jgi:hypothetical protein